MSWYRSWAPPSPRVRGRVGPSPSCPSSGLGRVTLRYAPPSKTFPNPPCTLRWSPRCERQRRRHLVLAAGDPLGLVRRRHHLQRGKALTGRPGARPQVRGWPDHQEGIGRERREGADDDHWERPPSRRGSLPQSGPWLPRPPERPPPPRWVIRAAWSRRRSPPFSSGTEPMITDRRLRRSMATAHPGPVPAPRRVAAACRHRGSALHSRRSEGHPR